MANEFYVFCDATMQKVTLSVDGSDSTYIIAGGGHLYIPFTSASAGKPVRLVSAISAYNASAPRAVYYDDGLSVWSNQRSYNVHYTYSKQEIAIAQAGLQIRIGMDKEEPSGSSDYAYDIILGEDIAEVYFLNEDGDGFDHIVPVTNRPDLIAGSPYTYGTNTYYYIDANGDRMWSSYETTRSFIYLASVSTSSGSSVIVTLDGVIKNWPGTMSYAGIYGQTVELLIEANPSYKHNFKCLSGIASYDVYKVDLIAGTIGKLCTIPNGTTVSNSLYYLTDGIYLTNFIAETDEYIFNMYEDIDGKNYQSTTISGTGRITDELWVGSQKRARYIQVEGTTPTYPYRIKLGDGISSCDVTINGETTSISYTDGYKLNYKSFKVRDIDTIEINNIKVDSTAYIHPYTIGQYENANLSGNAYESALESGDSASIPVNIALPYLIISATENLTTVRIETTGIDSCMIYAGGTYVGKLGTATDTGASDTLNVQPDSLIDIPPFDAYQRSIISLTLHYDPSKYVISFYRKDETDPWWTGTFNYLTGAAFNADDDHYKVTIVGTLYTMLKLQRRINESIRTCQMTVDDKRYGLATTPPSYTDYNRRYSTSVYPDSAIVISDITANDSSYTGPVVVKFYQRSTYYADDNECTEILKSDDNNVVVFTMTENRRYFEISMSVPKFSWYDADADDAKIVKGALVSENLTAERWNKLQAKIALMYKVNGRIFNDPSSGSPVTTYSYDEVKSKKIIYATLFNAVVKAINQLPGSQTKQLPSPNKGTGATVYAEYFQGGLGKVFGRYSVKDSLNAAIDYFNGDT